MSGRLEGKVVVVTGSGQSIGRSIAHHFSGEGASVVVNSRTEKSHDDTSTAADTFREIVDAGGKAAVAYADVGTMSGAKTVIDTAMGAFGGVDILINNAGGGVSVSSIEHIEELEWDSIIAANLKSQYACTHFAVPYMRRSGWGRIVNIGSILGIYGLPQFSAYATAKSGVFGLTVSLAHELAGTGITVNCVLPSAATTRNNRDRAEREAKTGLVVPQSPDRVPEAIAPLVTYLATADAQALSGQIFSISAGRITHHLWPPLEQTLTRPGKWTLDELIDEFPNAFGVEHCPVLPKG